MAQGISETIDLDVGEPLFAVQRRGPAERRGGGQRSAAHDATRVGAIPRGSSAGAGGARVGTHSRWISQAAEVCCEEVLVANPRELRFIYANDRKSDELDARALARVGRLDTSLLAPNRHQAA